MKIANEYNEDCPLDTSEHALQAHVETTGTDEKTTKRRKPSVQAAGQNSRKFIGWTRFMAVVPVIGLFVAALALTTCTLYLIIVATFHGVIGSITIQAMLVEYIEYADFFLLAIVLYIMSIGLYSLFIDKNVETPEWLEINDLDDLKEKLIAVIAVVMAVHFLGMLLHGAESFDIALYGLGIGVVIIALAYFVRHVIGK